MKHFFLLITFCVWTIHAFAQSEDAELTSIQKAYEACISMRDAVGANDKEAIRSAASNLGACDTKEFNSLRSKSDEESINGHLLFDEVFASAWLMVKTFINKQILLVEVDWIGDKLLMVPS